MNPNGEVSGPKENIWDLGRFAQLLIGSTPPEQQDPQEKVLMLIAQKYEEELYTLRQQHAEWQQQVERQFEFEMKRKDLEVADERVRTQDTFNRQLEEVKLLYTQQLEQQRSIYGNQASQALQVTTDMNNDLANVRQQLEIARQQLLDTEQEVSNYKSQHQDMTSRVQVLQERLDSYEKEVAKVQSLCDQLREDNRKSEVQLKQPMNAEIVNRLSSINTSQSVIVEKDSARSTISAVSSTNNVVQNLLNDVKVNEEVLERKSQAASVYDSASVNWDLMSVLSGHQQPSLLSQQNLAADNHINSGQATQVNTKRNKHPAPPFMGTFNPTAQQWLSQFRKLVRYHNYTEDGCIAEFMMAMQGRANTWWNTLPLETQGNFELLVKAFQKFYGDETHDMSCSISNVFSMKQGNEPMYIFGPKLLLEVLTVARDNAPPQMNFFYRAVNQAVADAVLPSRPASINDAVNIAIELERNVKFKFPYLAPPSGNSSSTVQPTPTVWNPMGSESRTDDAMMDKIFFVSSCMSSGKSS